MSYREFGHQCLEHRLAHFRRWLGDLEYCSDVPLDRQTAEYRCFLRQVADAEPSTTIHREIRDIAAIEADDSGIGCDQPSYDVKAGRLTRAVGSEQPYRLAALHRHVDVTQHRPPLESLSQPVP